MKIDTSKLVDWFLKSNRVLDRTWVEMDLAPRIDALNAEVDRLDGINSHLDREVKEAIETIKAMKQEVQELHARLSNAIEVDWSMANEDENGFVGHFCMSRTKWQFFGEETPDGAIFIPRPTPVKREKTREEKIFDLRGLSNAPMWRIKAGPLDRNKLKDETIDDLCRAAGIDLMTEEK